MTKRPKLALPAGACDTHMHVYDSRFPLAATATFKPPEAPAAEYLDVRKRLGISRTIVVQPTAYGIDNSCTLEAVSAMGRSARAVVVVHPDTADAELERLTGAGACGIRFHMLPGGVLRWADLEPMVARLSAFGWHAQLQLDGRSLPAAEALLLRLPGRLVVDHVGKFLEPVPLEHEAFRCLLRLVERGRTWVKLSAPYETSKTGAPHYEDVAVLAKALVLAAPERMLWASNWPHPGRPREQAPDDADLLDLLLDWAPDEGVRSRILVYNPAELYGFPSS